MSPNIKHDTTEKSAPLSDIFAANTQFNHSPVLRGHVTIARQMRALSLGHVTQARPMRMAPGEESVQNIYQQNFFPQILFMQSFSPQDYFYAEVFSTQRLSPHYLYHTPKYLCRHYSHKSKLQSKSVKLDSDFLPTPFHHTP